MAKNFKYSFKTMDSGPLSLVVYNVGFQKCSPNHGWGPGVREHFLIHYVVSGGGSFRAENRTFVLRAGDAFLIRPDVPVAYTASESDPWEYYWVGFSGAGAELLLARTGFSRERPVLSLQRGDRFRQALLDIYKARGNDYPSAVRMAGYLQAALGLLMEEDRPRGEEALDTYAIQGAEYIQRNYARRLTVEGVAAQVGVSRSCLYRAFMLEYDCSPSDYLIRYRVERACQLLGHSELSVGAVAASVGFEDPYYFSRAFRRAMGTTPSAYREEMA